MRSYLDRTRDALQAWVERHEQVRWHRSQAGFLAWLELRGVGSNPAEVLHRKARVMVSPGTNFAPPGSVAGRGFVRFNHATSLPLLAEMIARVGSALD